VLTSARARPAVRVREQPAARGDLLQARLDVRLDLPSRQAGKRDVEGETVTDQLPVVESTGSGPGVLDEPAGAVQLLGAAVAQNVIDVNALDADLLGRIGPAILQ